MCKTWGGWSEKNYTPVIFFLLLYYYYKFIKLIINFYGEKNNNNYYNFIETLLLKDNLEANNNLSMKKFTTVTVLLSIFFMEAMKQWNKCFKHYEKTCHQEGMWYGYIKSSVFMSVRKTNNDVSHCCTNTVDTRSSSFVLISHLMKGKDPRLQNCHPIECQFCKSRGKIMRIITVKILLSEITFWISLLHQKKMVNTNLGKCL